ncbi:hypothetical protein JEQ12_020162 [Ovis aries]|uniref:Uncharacterized protein n=1 Tax=Ovis aries TaxID=9940 RepID=A0A835ZJB1_SHEEP|nr:hypothetical protein JEQ12_020162 [Ovis aries]
MFKRHEQSIDKKDMELAPNHIKKIFNLTKPHETLGALGDEVRLSVLLKALSKFLLKRRQEPGNTVAAHAMRTWHCTLAIHIGHRTGRMWPDGRCRSRELQWMSPTQIQGEAPQQHLSAGESLGDLMSAGSPPGPSCSDPVACSGQTESCSCPGLVDIGVTLLCPENLGPDEVEELENQALLPDLQQTY